jgi:Crinkler effector protein N-terminal domain
MKRGNVVVFGSGRTGLELRMSHLRSPSTLAFSRSLSLMADDTRVLFCLIERDAKLFQVTVSTGESIAFLKKVIWEEGKNGPLRDVDAADLVLWKVSRFSRNYPVFS